MFQMLPLMQSQMVPLKKSFTAFVTNMLPYITATAIVSPVMLGQAMLLGKTFATVRTYMRFWFWLWWSGWHYTTGRCSNRTVIQLAHGSWV